VVLVQAPVVNAAVRTTPIHLVGSMRVLLP
jgi:hypothetical protein